MTNGRFGCKHGATITGRRHPDVPNKLSGEITQVTKAGGLARGYDVGARFAKKRCRRANPALDDPGRHRGTGTAAKRSGEVRGRVPDGVGNLPKADRRRIIVFNEAVDAFDERPSCVRIWIYGFVARHHGSPPKESLARIS